MESDMPSSSLASLLNDEPLPGLLAEAEDPNRITVFSEAIAALQSHSFKDASNFEDARRAAQTLHSRTFLTINSADISNLQAARDRLHFSDDFLAYIATLHASLAVVSHDFALIGQLLTEFRKMVVETRPLWARSVPVRWVGMCRHAARVVIEKHDVSLAMSMVLPLRAAAETLAPAPDYLVPVQADFLAICLEAKCYKMAATWLRQHRRLKVDVNNTALAGTDVHLIQHYSAMIFIGVKDFRAALLCCRLALSIPAPSPGQFYEVIGSTYRLYVLLHLLVAGVAPTPVKFSSYQSARMRKGASEYMELAHAYEERDKKKVIQIVESNRDTFKKQGNWGLVKQVARTLSRELIVRLTKSFMTMKLEDVAEKSGLVSVEETHSVILEMVRSQIISASVDDREGVVQFTENSSNGAHHISTRYMDDCVNTVQRIETFREELESDPFFVAKELASEQNSRRPPLNVSTFGAGSSKMDPLEAEWMR